MCGTKPANSAGQVTENTKPNVTYTSDINSLVTTNGVVSKEKLDRFVNDIQYRVYTRTSNNTTRIAAFSNMIRYVNGQIALTSDTNKKIVLSTLKNRFNRIIMSLRQDIINGVVMTPNRKKNDTNPDLVTIALR